MTVTDSDLSWVQALRPRDFSAASEPRVAELAALADLKHPNLLKVTQGLAETKDYLAFATEPCFASLANVLG